MENAFGILVKRWEIFRSPIRTDVRTTIKIVKTACILHNYLLSKCQQEYSVQFDADKSDKLQVENSILQPLVRTTGTNSDDSAKINRETFCTYFKNAGAVAWQDSYI